MSYSSTNPPALVSQRVAGGPALWIYKSTDNASIDALGSGFYANGGDLGMRAGDFVIAISNTAGTTYQFTLTCISSISSTGSAAGSTVAAEIST